MRKDRVRRTWGELHERLRRLGGTTRVVILDNLKEGVLTPDFLGPPGTWQEPPRAGENPRIPCNPPRRVWFGLQSYDEMGMVDVPDLRGNATMSEVDVAVLRSANGASLGCAMNNSMAHVDSSVMVPVIL